MLGLRKQPIGQSETKIIEFPNKKVVIQPQILTILNKYRCAIRYDTKRKIVEVECSLFAEQFEDTTVYHAAREFYFNNPIQGNVESFILLLKRKIESTDFSKKPEMIKTIFEDYQQLKQKYDESAA